ncbi:unnamed protein product [Chrysodeixis includens]|uniref:Uncharacterized protein n=1 Tax=Chrysodeixis includens TaxID=689277 RepID=A0A9P0BWY5_CHRIL|nr:unnamed protein product [Chrysodeixis includens]
MDPVGHSNKSCPNPPHTAWCPYNVAATRRPAPAHPPLVFRCAHAPPASIACSDSDGARSGRFSKKFSGFPKMKIFIFDVFFAVVLLSQQCLSLPVEESVVSVYTTHPTTLGTNPPLDVYHQIANNLAERITLPIYRFLGINSTKPETTTKSWDNIELLDEDNISNKKDVKPIDNDISKDRDVEELSVEGLKKAEKKPEKITLYSSYLPPISSKLVSIENSEAKNSTANEIDDDFDWDLDESPKSQSKQSPLIYILEFFGSMIQLVWGGLMALFRPAAS